MNDNSPMYQQIELFIEEKIGSGEWAVGSQVPKEIELCEMFSASRMTVSKALGNLVTKGLIYRNAGKGTFVRMRWPENKVKNMFSFSETMRILGKEPHSRVKEYAVLHSYTIPEVQSALKLKDDDFVHRIARIRIADAAPIAAEIIYLSAPIVPIVDTRVIEKSLFEYLESTLNLTIHRSDVKIQAMPVTPMVESLFGERITQPLLKISTISYLSNGEPFEISETYYLSDKYTYTTSNFR